MKLNSNTTKFNLRSVLMLILKCVLVLIPTGIAIYEACKDGKKTQRAKRMRSVLVTASLVSCVAACVVVYRDDRDANSFQRDTTVRLSKIGAMGNDEEASKRYFEIIRASISSLNAKTPPVEQFLATQRTRQLQREETIRINEAVLNKHLIRVQPVCDYVVNRFETWVSGLQAKGITVSLTTNIMPVPVQTKAAAGGTISRTATFTQGKRLRIQVEPAVISDGVLSTRFRMELHSDIPSVYGDFWAVEVGNDDYGVKKFRERFSYVAYSGTSKDPFTDKNFLESMQGSFDEVMTYLVDEATNPP